MSRIEQFPGDGPATAEAFEALANKPGVEVIEMAEGTYRFRPIGRTGGHPLTIRPAKGAQVTFEPTPAEGGPQ